MLIPGSYGGPMPPKPGMPPGPYGPSQNGPQPGGFPTQNSGPQGDSQFGGPR